MQILMNAYRTKLELMEGEKIFCEHFIDKNVCKSVAGKKIYRDQCSKCYDDSVRNKKSF